MGIRDRLARLEQQHATGAPGLQIIEIRGGLPDDGNGLGTASAWRAEDWSISYTRFADEGESAFKDRVTADARLHDAEFVLIGGLPHDEVVP